MPIDFRNTNSVWASVFVETLVRLGLRTAVICPGSRSAPLAIAFAAHAQVEAIPVLDERSAAFFALGMARRTGEPVVLVCTSGTAGANFYPAIIEAKESCVPLLVLTADRPPELRDCNAGQTVDQQKLYGTYPNWYSELSVPALEQSLLAYLRQTVIYAWERSQYPVSGCVHLNLPFRDPLAPVPQAEAQAFAAQFDELEQETFFAAVGGAVTALRNRKKSERQNSDNIVPSEWFAEDRGIVIAGVAQPRSPQAYCEAIAHLAQTLKLPVLAEGLSPVRNYAVLNPDLISTYDLILRQPDWADKLRPDFVIRIGEMPTSKELRQWLTRTQPRQWIIDATDRHLDPLHLPTVHLRRSIDQVAACLSGANSPERPSDLYLQHWCQAEAWARQAIDHPMAQLDPLIESKVAWLLSQHLPEATPVIIANSTAVRDVEWFWKPGNTKAQPYFNRGANGIDGTLSTALGIAHGYQSSVLLTGDLALLHDTNGFLLRNQFQGHLTIVLINNNGGGIFELLPIAQFDPPFEAFFATPQSVNVAQLCAAYRIEYEQIQTWEQLIQRLKPLPTEGVRVLEIPCDRKASAHWRQQLFSQFSDCDR
ncbi:2-succinyl-5-enolpyruvyl-6-hydroxy-3-cyclohexene-1-carboxylic-acid synthase [Thermocoleostomius sinensis]|uniref:2-succinyl-5-enolpyruvyl-6-hydroxy-3-cyclohexene-1-carboxylate synthase n=1 Tax=Thermocoleostomius sinensis A174 TaxID=2016057 RepID=A0A9E8ZBK3_9CYAN|nr:2-succinyl-5-enolpyruvyl-6-hydroxy-3-cyclohexene-1-carboxylic-acid synthase [Thermocoleostomius sinensis]WAL60133.1 2-succinyl-5-enolpyruvyl-6-hydroxy-3-cyclohexene-1-carboxylic-acid synthase [Thermocoleostomius sinensis A174]